MELCQLVSRISADSVHFIEESKLDVSLFSEKEILRNKGFMFMEARFSEISKERELLEFIAEVMKFPDYFGKNWNALIDCMSDMAWLPAKGYVLVLYGSGKIWREQPLLIGHFVECWLFCAERWRSYEKPQKEPAPFHLVFAFD